MHVEPFDASTFKKKQNLRKRVSVNMLKQSVNIMITAQDKHVVIYVVFVVIVYDHDFCWFEKDNTTYLHEEKKEGKNNLK